MANKFFWLSASFIMALASCGGSTPRGPELKINDERTGLIWDEVEGATGYEIDVDGVKDLKIAPGYDFSTTVGQHKVIVTPLDENGGQKTSSTFEFETKESALGDLSFADNKITWASAATCGLEYKVNDGDFKPVTGNFIEATEQGLFTVIAPKKIDDQHVFYNKKVEKYITVTQRAQAEYVIEDATAPDDATLSEQYTMTKYSNNGWVEAASTVSLDKTQKAYVTDKCANYKFWRQDIYYKFSKAIDLDGSYNELSFSMKSEESVDLYLAFEVGHTMIVGNMNLNGVYITYPISEAPTKWTHYRVTMDDPKWVVTFSGMKKTFAEIKEIVKGYGFYVNSLADFLPYFDTFQIRIKGTHDENWSTCRAYFDDIKLVNSDLTTSEITEIIPVLSLADTYAFKSDAIPAGNLSINGNNGVFSIPAMSMSIPVTCAVADNKATVTSTESGKDFVAVFSSPDGGMTLKLESVTGTLSPYFTNLQVEAVNKLDDFESYTETGVGYDQSHPDETLRSGLRGAYYCDYWSGGSGSPVGGDGWSLMGSNDYLKLADDVSHSGSKSMSLKGGSNTCRYMTYGLKDGVEDGYKGKYFSFWAKSTVPQDMTLRISVYYQPKVESSTQQSSRSYLECTINANSDWQEIKIELKTTETYYGFAVTTLYGTGSPTAATRIYIDDVYIFGDLSPWGN